VHPDVRVHARRRAALRGRPRAATVARWRLDAGGSPRAVSGRVLAAPRESTHCGYFEHIPLDSSSGHRAACLVLKK
jgi:hypothetical protein